MVCISSAMKNDTSSMVIMKSEFTERKKYTRFISNIHKREKRIEKRERRRKERRKNVNDMNSLRRCKCLNYAIVHRVSF